MEKKKIGLLPKIVIAIASGIVCGLFFPDGLVRIFLTVNGLFSNFLGFIIPLLILGLVAPGIADLGKGAGRLLLITALLATAAAGKVYRSMVFYKGDLPKPKDILKLIRGV